LRRKSEEELRTLSTRPHTPRSSVTSSNNAHDALRRDLAAVLESVRVVQASWVLVQPGLQAHAREMTRAFLARCPDALNAAHVRGKHGAPLSAPEMGPIMLLHSATLLTLVGQCVAGQRDFDAMRPTLVACGRMHARFSAHVRDFLPGLGAALTDTLRDALGADAAFPPEVEGAWAAAYAWVATAMLAGLCAAEADSTAQEQLRSALVLVPPPTAGAAAARVFAAA
jgi:hypothetical protein